MSVEGLQMKKDQMENYFLMHPDSITVKIVGSEGVTFPAFFDYSFQSGNKDSGNVEQQKRAPHLTFFSGYESLLEGRKTKVEILEKTFTVFIVKSDLTHGTFQAEAWLV